MGVEIERKFLVKDEQWRTLAKGKRYQQGYLSTDKDRTVRVRTIGDKGYLTVKGISTGASRLEFEYEIPVAEAQEMLSKLCHQPIIDKHRYKIPIDNLVWEVDEFHGENEGLIVVEVELEHEEQFFEKPDWVGEEVTHEKRYFNSFLVKKPYSTW